MECTGGTRSTVRTAARAAALAVLGAVVGAVVAAAAVVTGGGAPAERAPGATVAVALPRELGVSNRAW